MCGIRQIKGRNEAFIFNDGHVSLVPITSTYACMQRNSFPPCVSVCASISTISPTGQAQRHMCIESTVCLLECVTIQKLYTSFNTFPNNNLICMHICMFHAFLPKETTLAWFLPWFSPNHLPLGHTVVIFLCNWKKII